MICIQLRFGSEAQLNFPKHIFVLTLHNHKLFVNDRNEDMLMKILEYIANKMQGPLYDAILGVWIFH